MSAKQSRHLGRITPVIIFAVTLLLALGAAELVLRVAVPRPDTYAMLMPGTTLVVEPDARFIHGIAGPARYEVTPEGFRGRAFGADADEYRILLVGGSTTECTLLDISENWGTILEHEVTTTQDGRSTWVGNVGRSGLTARDHAVTVKHLLREYPRIDLVIVLVGVNDLTAALRQGDSYRRPRPITEAEAERIQVRNAFFVSPEGLYRPLTDDVASHRPTWYESTRLFDLAQRARSARRARAVAYQLRGGNLEQWRGHRQSASALLDTLPDLTEPLAEYYTNLDAIVTYAREAGSDVMFLTQPSLWHPDIAEQVEHLLWLGGTGPFQDLPGQSYYTVRALASAMDRYNQVTLQTCRDHGLSCFDLAAAVPPDTTLLYDDVHFTEAGSALVGRLVSRHLRTARPGLFGPAPAITAR